MNFVFRSVSNMKRVDFILELSEIEGINGIMLLTKAFSLSIAFFISICILYDVCKTITPSSQETLCGTMR